MSTHSVPPGFCLPARSLGLLLGELRDQRLLRDIVSRAYAQLAERARDSQPRVAVRSSAIDEDGEAASFAGQHETYLNLSGSAEIVDAVTQCWESSHSDRALAYRGRRGLSLDDLRIAVLVQQLVPADVSAVSFSANPVSGSLSEVVVTATYGLGESLVGGTTTPDTWRIDKSTFSVVSRQLGAKERMTIGVAGGTREVPVPRLLRQQAALDDGKVVDVARLTLTLERVMGRPVDIECAFAGDQLHLLQCRPITSGLKALR